MFLGFYGLHSSSIDAKNRCVIPAAFRHDLGKQCVLSCGTEHGIQIFTMEGWHEFLKERLHGKPYEDPNVRALEWRLRAGMAVCEIDGQGRILLPKTQFDHSQIKKEIVFLGAGERIEMLSKENYDKIDEALPSLAELYDSMLEYTQRG